MSELFGGALGRDGKPLTLQSPVANLTDEQRRQLIDKHREIEVRKPGKIYGPEDLTPDGLKALGLPPDTPVAPVTPGPRSSLDTNDATEQASTDNGQAVADAAGPTVQ